MHQVSEQRNGRVRSFGMKLDGLIRTSLMAYYICNISIYNRRHLSDVSCHTVAIGRMLAGTIAIVRML